MPSMLPIAIGVPNTGGSVVTASGLTFIAASHDRYLRVIDTRNGRELRKFRLPAGGQATPMTFWSAVSKRQFVVIAAGGNPGIDTHQGDYLLAYAQIGRAHVCTHVTHAPLLSRLPHATKKKN